VVMFEAALREATISGIFNLESVSNVVPPAGRGQDPT
jgi:pyruvoyl-dependent arginine decarboxylase (PvlArgDC)